MAQISEITVEDLLKVRRFDADFFRADYLQYENELKAIDHTKFEDIAYVTDGDHGSPDFDDSSNIIYLSAKTVKNNYFDLSNAETISEEQHKRNKRSSLKEGDIILSTVGTIGNVAVVQKEMLPGNMDRHVGLIRLNSLDNEKPYFYSAFLDSKYGRFQSMRHSTGNVQLNLFISKMNEFIVPEWNKQAEKIAKDVKKNYELRQKSKSLYSQAEQLLLQELGLEDFTPEWAAGYQTDHDNILEVARMDAEYFQPRYRIVEEKIKDVALPLSEICSIKRGSMISMDYYNEDSGTPYLRGADFSSGEIGETKLVFIDNSFEKSNETTVKTNDIIFASIGSVGTSALVTPNFNGSFISNNTGRLRIKNKAVLPEYLHIALQSLVGQMQFERQQTQTAQPKISNDQMGAMKIPVLSMNRQKQISNLVIESFESKKESRQFLEQAKREVEEMIEKQSNAV